MGPQAAGTLGEDLNPWAVEMFRTFRTIAPATPLPAVGEEQHVDEDDALDNPFHDGIGGLEPTAMERTLVVLDQELQVVGNEVTFPCDARGRPMTGRPLRGPRDRPSRRGGSGLGHVTPAG